MRQAFRQPGFTRLYAGLTTSMFGDSVMLLVLSMWVKSETGSNAQAGLTFFFMAIPALAAPLMGIGIDRVRRKPLLVWGPRRLRRSDAAPGARPWGRAGMADL